MTTAAVICFALVAVWLVCLVLALLVERAVDRFVRQDWGDE